MEAALRLWRDGHAVFAGAANGEEFAVVHRGRPGECAQCGFLEAYLPRIDIGLAEEPPGLRLGKSEGLMERWSRKFDWGGRVMAYDAHLVSVERQATEAVARSKSAEWLARQVDQRDEEWKARNEVLELARAAIGRWKSNEKRCGSLEGIARLLEDVEEVGASLALSALPSPPAPLPPDGRGGPDSTSPSKQNLRQDGPLRGQPSPQSGEGEGV